MVRDLTILDIQESEHAQELFANKLNNIMDTTAGMLSDVDTMMMAKKTNSLTINNLKAFTNNVNDFSGKMGLDLIVEAAGLESNYSNNLEAGLESVMETVTKAIQFILAAIDKAINNLVKWGADIYTKIVTRTKQITKELDDLEEKIKKNSNGKSIEVQPDSYVNMVNKFTALNVSIGSNINSPKTVLEGLTAIVECMSDSKIPELDKQADGTIGFKKAKRTTLEDVLLFNIISGAKEESLRFLNSVFPGDATKLGKEIYEAAETKIVSVKGESIEFILFTKEGRILQEAYTMTYKKHGTEIEQQDTIPSDAAVKLIDSMHAGIKAIETVRKENDKRIKEMKDFSKQALKKFDDNKLWEDDLEDSTEEQKKMYEEHKIKDYSDKAVYSGKKMSYRFNQLNKEVSHIWNLYPKIANRSIVNLFWNIDTITKSLASAISAVENETVFKDESKPSPKDTGPKQIAR